MNRAKLFIENFFTYGFIQVLNKIIPFLLLPVITKMLPNTADFGIYDMYNLIIGFGTPFVILGLFDAMFREYFEKEDYQYRLDVTTTTQRMILVSSLIISTLLLVFNKSFSYLFFGTSTFGNVIICSAIAVFLASNLSPIQAPTRLKNQRKIFVYSGLIGSGGQYLISITLLYLGFSYFSLIYAKIMTSIILILFFWLRNKEFFLLGKFNKDIAKELLKIGLPLLPTFLIYWVYNSMDKIMITNILGISELGIYSIGSRIAQISQFIYLAFAGGWQYFAFSTMKDEDYKHLMGKIWENMFIISTCFFVGAFLFKDIIFNTLFEGDYVKGVVVFPYLVLAPFLLMFYQITGTQFQIIKQTFYSPLLLLTGAITNVVLNMYLIPTMGIEGAAIATISGYFVTNLLSILVVVKIKKLIIFSKKNIFMILIFIFLFIIINCRVFNNYTVFACCGYLGLCFILYYKKILKFIKNRRYKK